MNVSHTKVYDADLVLLKTWNQKLFETSKLMKQPKKYDSNGEFTIYVNENMKIYKIEIHLIGNCCVDTAGKPKLVYC